MYSNILVSCSAEAGDPPLLGLLYSMWARAACAIRNSFFKCIRLFALVSKSPEAAG